MTAESIVGGKKGNSSDFGSQMFAPSFSQFPRSPRGNASKPRRIVYSNQAAGLFPDKTIYGNIATVQRLLKWEESRIRKRVDELLSMLRLEPENFRDRYSPELPGGRQRRVGVACCLAADPKISPVDEPFGVAKNLCTKETRKLNAAADVEHKDVFAVARQWLKKQGSLK